MKLKLDKDPWYYSWFDRDGSIFATTNPDLHKLRSAPIKKGLSQTSIVRVEHVLKEHIGRLVGRIEGFRDEGKPVKMEDAYRSLAADIVLDVSLPKSMDLLSTPDMGHMFHEATRSFTMGSIWNRHFPFLTPMVDALPPSWVATLMGEAAANVIKAVAAMKDQAVDLIKNDGKPISSKSFPVILNEMYRSEELPASEKSPKRLFDEISILIGAGSETTSFSLSTITYYVLADPKILKRLQAELRERFTEDERKEIISYRQLETLPYLTAVITEGLRIATGVSGRFPRINKHQPMSYTSPLPNSKTYVIPPGSPISMSIREMHYNPECFPSPHTFDPERFLGPNKAANMKWFATFGRGPRSCIGQNLAWAELYMAIGNLFARFDVKLADGIDEADVLMAYECFTPFIAEGRQGVTLDVLK